MATAERPAQYVGARLPRVEDARYLRGVGRFVDDLQLPGMLHAAFFRSPYAHARIVSIDVAKARGLPGVVDVITGADVTDITPLTAGLPRPEVKANSRHALPTDRVRFVGEAVAAVVATSRYVAEDACALIEVEWEPLPVITNAEASLAPAAPLLHDGTESNSFAHIEYEQGDVAKAFAEADRVFSKRFHQGRFHAAPLETRGIVAEYDSGTVSFTMWTSSQVPHLTRSLLAHALGLTFENGLRVIAPDVGGGFGLKIHLFPEDLLVPYLARRTGRPVKWIEDRYENLAASVHAKEIIMELELATTSDGKFLAFRGRYVGDAGAYAAYPWTPLVDPLCAAVMLPSLYDVPAARYEVDAAYTNKCPAGAYRGVGWTSGQAARELLIDEAARGLGIDPLELRLRNTIGNDPYVSATGCRYDGGSYAEAQRRAMDALDYPGFRERQSRLREEGRYLGIGFSPFLEPGGWSGDLAKRMGFPFDYMDAANVTVAPDGSVTVTLGLHSHGQAHETTLAQVVADRLGVKVESVRIVEGDTAATAYGTGTWGSRSAVVGSGSITRAAAEVREKMVAIAAHALEASPEDIEIYDGNATVKGSPDKSISVTMIAYTAYFGAFVGGSRPPGLDPALTATRSYEPPESYANGCVAAIVEVDVETGAVTLERVVAVEDCGTMLNPMVVEGQIAGAVAQGIGGALYEDLPYDENGQFLAASLLDYLYPSTMEIPTIEIHHIETPSTVTEGGIKGCGEGGTIAAPAAVVNAVADALSPLGVTIDRTPLSPDRVLSLIRAAG
ncbi:MAG TPA: xanthine dehydrogenase family protein molybdopterin-binding subunit [Gaiellaceae bacterium]|nr:xanthine dehydrogenase family protein molybdopterin-binding subunit [Gaiellaceae bacterium]